MAVNVGTVPVYPDGSNNPQTGWTQAHVMDALEKAFYEMGFNSGTQKDGVPCAVMFPGGSPSGTYDFAYCVSTHNDESPQPYASNTNDRWNRCGGDALIAEQYKQRYFYVTNSGTQSYQMAEELIPNTYQSASSNVISLTHYMGNDFQNGTKLTYNGQGIDVIGGLSSGNVYYMRRVGDNGFSLHDSASNAQNASGTAGIYTIQTTSMTTPLRFRTDAVGPNPSITCNVNDELYFYTHATTDGGQFRICDFLGGSGYNADRDLHNSDKIRPTAVSGSGTFSDPYRWQTRYWQQTENEYKDPTKTVPNSGYTSLAAYGYANTANSLLKGTITLNNTFQSNGSGYYSTYYKYTVTGASADAANPSTPSGRTDLKLRIYRSHSGGSSYYGRVSGIHICNEATGWRDNDVFTIPGAAIGGASPANDIVFGPNAWTTGYTGTPNILTTNLGSGANMFQKHPDGHYGVLRLENDNTKTYGHTYWGFAFAAANMYQMTIQCGSGWSYLNRLGKHFVYNSGYEGHFGCFNGDMGLDYQSGNNELHRNSFSNMNFHNYAYTSQPTNYPLRIRYYKAQAPQDTNFAVIQFTQTILGVEQVYFTFSLPKGSGYGSNVWDLNEVWNGTYNEYKTNRSSTGTSNNWVKTIYHTPGYDWSNGGPHEQPVSSSSLAREANYGYLRSTVGHSVPETRYGSNIDWSNNNEEDNVYQYYRIDAYDKYESGDGDIQVKINGTKSPGVSYYKPLKGLPISNHIVPCPYYLPDDFVIIQAEVTPGATEFRVGDTITVSGSEVYTIITADEYNNQTGLDGIDSNTANGVIFAARIP